MRCRASVLYSTIIRKTDPYERCRSANMVRHSRSRVENVVIFFLNYMPSFIERGSGVVVQMRFFLFELLKSTVRNEGSSSGGTVNFFNMASRGTTVAPVVLTVGPTRKYVGPASVAQRHSVGQGIERSRVRISPVPSGFFLKQGN